MSKYEWERATLILPTAEVPRLKAVLRDHQNALHEAVRKRVAEMHAVAKGTRSVKTYLERLAAHYGGRVFPGRNYDRLPVRWETPENWGADLSGVASTFASMVVTSMLTSGSVHKPTVAEVSRVIPKATNRTKEFDIIGEWGSCFGTITFSGREVTWDVDENNHAVDHAHDSLTGQRFFSALDKIVWTRGTGGVGVGNDEYHSEDSEVGGGGNYSTFAYGPLGEQEKASEWGMTLAQYREMQARSTVRTRFAW